MIVSRYRTIPHLPDKGFVGFEGGKKSCGYVMKCGGRGVAA